MSTLTLIKYNNYFNRILKGVSFHSLNDYSSIPGSTFNRVNFDKKDGIDTYHYLNIPNIETADILENYDYLLVSDDGSDEIKSKWFITEHKWTRQRQYKLTLHRDVLADKYDKYKDQPFYCRRGLPDVDSPLVYNSEGRQYNQILKSRTLLKQDENQENRYIIGFVDKTWKKGSVYPSGIPEEKYSMLEEIPEYLDCLRGSQVITEDIALYFLLLNTASPSGTSTSGDAFMARLSLNNVGKNDSWDTGYELHGIAGGQGLNTLSLDATMTAVHNNNEDELYGDYLSIIKNGSSVGLNIHTSTFWANAERKIIQIGGSDKRVYAKDVMVGSKKYTFWREDDSTPTHYYDTSISVYLEENAYRKYIRLIQHEDNTIWYKGAYIANESAMIVPVNAVYECGFFESEGGTEITVPEIDSKLPYNIFVIEDDPDGIARNFAGEFAAQYAGGHVLYDLQLFPYAPDTLGHENPSTDGSVNINTAASPIYLEWATSDSKAFFCTHDEIKTYSGSNNTAIMNNKKAGANQDMCRIVAPDGSNAWDFNPALIGGVPANSIKYEFTLIPFASYLHIYPTFNNLYGTVNKSVGDKAGETRGMVCTGPWSLPYSTDNWATYQLQNSAFRDSFNRQVENMSVVQDIQRAQEVFQLGIAPYQGLFGGLGSSPLGPISAIAGMTLGTASAAADLELGDIARKEQINYTKDQFYNSLRNIQAQARPLASNSSITIGNSWFPIIEYYSATDEEKQFLIEDLKVHGWMMGIATTFSTIRNNITNQHTYTVYPTRYIQGDLINVDIGEDSHMSNEIARELNEGVYIDHV